MKIHFNKYFVTSMLVVTLTGAAMQATATTTVEVFKSPTCGCCTKWVEYLREHGFTVNTHDVGNKEARAKAGISPSLGSCHTATVGGYAIEGHVPAEDIKRLLKERPRAVGLTVPDMPHGSPGMETGRVDPYDVLLIRKPGDERNATIIYSRHGSAKPQQTSELPKNESTESILRLK